MSAPLDSDARILLVEDDPATAELERRALVRAGREVDMVGLVAAALEAIERQSYAAIVLDYRLPDGDPWPVLESAQRALPPIPVVLVTAVGSERIAAEVLHRGGADYLIKTEGFWEQLAVAVDRILHATAAERTSNLLAALVESTDDAIFTTALDGRILTWNAAAESLFGYTVAEMIGNPESRLLPADRRQEEATLVAAADCGETTRQLETVRIRKDGSAVEVVLTVSPILDGAGRVTCAAHVVRDVTERKRTERLLRIRTDIGRVIASSESIAEAAPDLLGTLCEGLGREVAALWVSDADGETMRCAGVWHRPEQRLEPVAAAARADSCARARLPAGCWLEATAVSGNALAAAVSGALGEALTAAGLRHALLSPLASRGNAAGMLAVFTGEAPTLDGPLAQMLGAVGSQIGQYVERCRASDALRESEAWLRLALDAADMGVWDIDIPSGRVVRSLRHDQIYGYETLQSSWSVELYEQRHLLREDEARWKAAFERALETGVLDLECRIRWLDGSTHWIDAKGRVLNDDSGRPARMMGVITEATAKKAAEEALRQNAELDRALFIGSPLPMWLFDIETLEILAVNDAAVLQYGYAREELLAMTLKEIRAPEDVPSLLASHQSEAVDYRHAGVFRHRRKDGSFLHVDVHVHDVWIGGRRLRLALLQDVTDREKLEAQLRQTQKMEAIGRLAGGIAHDFNNLLTVVNGYADLLLRSSAPGDGRFEELSEIGKAGARAAALTRQLLAFSRKREVDPKILDLNALVTDMSKMLQRLIGEDVHLVTSLSPVLGRVKADPSHLEQVVMNFAVNARDAMGSGGTLTIETSNVELHETYVRSHLDVPAGNHVLLAVTDTGCGMDEATRSRIFEPFFTTKEPGRGTGLGLATVFGIVKESGGHVNVYSEPGRGTTLKIYLPRVEAPVSVRAHCDNTRTAAPRGETVLLVEDDEAVRHLTAHILEHAGYVVQQAASSEEALRLAGDRGMEIDLLVSDVVMPGMMGPELARQVVAIRPALKRLFLSGYTERTVRRNGDLDGAESFLEKPFTPQSLLAKVREVLDSRA